MKAEDVAAWLTLYGPVSPNEHANGASMATAIRELIEERDRLRAVLEWYGEQARLARLIHSEGDAGRNAIANDGGKRARAALEPRK